MPLVLLVDDQPFIGAAVGGLLAADRDLELRVCHAPGEAQDLAARLRPAVVLIDLVMPDVDGLTLIRRLRADPATSKIPLIAMSGNADEQSRQNAIGAGASDFVVKLPSSQELIALIRRHAAGGAPAPDRPAGVESVPAVPAAQPAPQRVEDQTLDRGVVAGLREIGQGEDPEFVASLIDLFISEAALQLEELRDAVTRADSDAMRNVAHRLSGSSYSIGARKLGRLSGQLEDHARRNRGGAVGRVLLAEITDEFAQVRSALAQERSGPGSE